AALRVRALGRRAAEGGQPAEFVDQFLAHLGECGSSEAFALIVGQRQENLDQVHRTGKAQVSLFSGSSGFASPCWSVSASASALRCCALPSSRSLPSPIISATASFVLPAILSPVRFSAAIRNSPGVVISGSCPA